MIFAKMGLGFCPVILGGNHISIQITNLLEGFFLAEEADKTKKYTAMTMLEELNNMANENQFDKYEVPKLQTICR